MFVYLETFVYSYSALLNNETYVSYQIYCMIAGKLIGKDAGNVGGLSSTYPKTFNQDTGHAGKDVPDGEVINIMQDEEEHSGKSSHSHFSSQSFRTVLKIYNSSIQCVCVYVCVFMLKACVEDCINMSSMHYSRITMEQISRLNSYQ
jgi:hypothetical protein